MAKYNTKPPLKSKHYDAFAETIPSLKGQTMAITGTTSGTGYVAAHTVARKGARVLLLNRPSERSTTSLAALKSECPSGEFIAIDCDLQSFDSVRKAADQIIAMCPDGLDVLCNNAGVMALSDKATGEGFDVQMQTNHLSHFLLTRRLFPLFEKAAELRGEARIVNHSSVARLGAKRLEAKYLEKNGGNLGGNSTAMFPFPGARWKRYSQTKLANCVFTSCLHEKLKIANPKIKASVAHPGLATTDLANSSIEDGGMIGWFTGFMMGFMYKRGQTPEDGAMGIIKCMAEKDLPSGVLVGPGKGQGAITGIAQVYPLDKYYDNDKTRDLLWSKSCEAIGEAFEIG